MIHRYDKNYLLPWYAINTIPEIGHEYMTCAMGGAWNNPQDVSNLYDMYIDHMPFSELMQVTAKLFFAIETYTIHSYGRFSIECAALGIPCIGCELVSSLKHCFPRLTTKSNDLIAIHDLSMQLIHDHNFYKDIVATAQEKVNYYSYDNCTQLMLQFLNS